MSNCYASVADVQGNLSLSSSTDVALILSLLKANSRWIDNYCNRHFYVETATKYFDAIHGETLLIDDLLTLTTFKLDTEQDGNFDDETWSDGTDFNLIPYNGFPKTKIEITTFGSYSFPELRKSVQIVGTWGYGDGERSSPVDDSGADTAEALDATETGVDVDDGTLFDVGNTILIDSEQMFVSSISTNTLTVERGVNGTTAAIHDTLSDIYVYKYPEDIRRFCEFMTADDYRNRSRAGMDSERIGDYSYKRKTDVDSMAFAERAIGNYRKLVVV